MTLTRSTPLKRKPMRKKPSPMAAADKLFSQLVRERGYCAAGGERFDCAGNLQCCHVVSRRYRAIRWDLSNAIPMCAAHHIYFTHHPLEWETWWDGQMPGFLASLKYRALNDPPEKPAEALARLRTMREGS